MGVVIDYNNFKINVGNTDTLLKISICIVLLVSEAKKPRLTLASPSSNLDNKEISSTD